MPLAGAHHFGACGVCGGTHTSRDDPTAARGDCSFIQRAIVSQNLDGIIRTRNQAAERLFGYTVEEVIGRPITMLVPAEDIREEADILERIRRVTALRHVNIPTATRCGYLDKPGATSERAMARGAPRSRPRGAQTAPWTGRLARTKERSHSWPVRLA
jgi:PAS domain-containing protein